MSPVDSRNGLKITIENPARESCATNEKRESSENRVYFGVALCIRCDSGLSDQFLRPRRRHPSHFHPVYYRSSATKVHPSIHFRNDSFPQQYLFIFAVFSFPFFSENKPRNAFDFHDLKTTLAYIFLSFTPRSRRRPHKKAKPSNGNNRWRVHRTLGRNNETSASKMK